MLFLMHRESWLWEPLKVVFSSLWQDLVSTSASSLFGTTSCPTLYISCLRPGLDRFSKEPYFPWWLQLGFCPLHAPTITCPCHQRLCISKSNVLHHFSSDLTSLWLINPSSWKCSVHLASKNTTLSWLSSSFVGLSSVSFAGSSSSSWPLNTGCPNAQLLNLFTFFACAYTDFICDVISFMTLDATCMLSPKVMANLNWFPEFQTRMSNSY